MANRPRVALYIDPPSHHFLQDRLFDTGAAKFGGDNLMAPYAALQEFFSSREIPIHTADLLPDDDREDVHNVYVSMGITSSYRRLATRRNVILSAFFAMECPIVEPSIYRELNRAQHVFKRIFSWSDSKTLERFVGGPLRCEPFHWPQSFDDVHEDLWRNEDRKFLVMINGNKLPRIYFQELYTERMRAVEFFSRTEDVDLYGTGWDGPSTRVGKTWVPGTVRRLHYWLHHRWDRIRPAPLLKAVRRAYRGRVDSKSETLSRYKFALCFENAILKGWVTEKIFDCFLTGTVPIYWGSPDIEKRIPPECFIDMRRFGGYPELREHLRALGPADLRRYRDSARDFLRSPAFQPYTRAAFVQRFADVVSADTGIRL